MANNYFFYKWESRLKTRFNGITRKICSFWHEPAVALFSTRQRDIVNRLSLPSKCDVTRKVRTQQMRSGQRGTAIVVPCAVCSNYAQSFYLWDAPQLKRRWGASDDAFLNAIGTAPQTIRQGTLQIGPKLLRSTTMNLKHHWSLVTNKKKLEYQFHPFWYRAKIALNIEEMAAVDLNLSAPSRLLLKCPRNSKIYPKWNTHGLD